ncbi:MAG: phosphate ABC transporter substrate-binding protein PstS [Coxiella sp. RIFCSPHIGHO2_12_FULL_44_14]|nr:MAG: phosphate ABC transporter substrate-binding protein PstS [Coxiella sp. RIFCSPHIGHO2_12_FULL_44_14]
MFLRNILSLLLFCLLLAQTSVFAQASAIGAGSTFVYPLIARWAVSFKKQTGHEINYQSIGSGGGLNQLRQRTVDFAAVDMPQSPHFLNHQQWIQFPLAMGAIVITINVPGIASNRLKLTGPVIADIFLGKITRWDDPAITALNPTLKLPAINIAVIHRADGSGTTFNFTHYLSLVSPTWANEVGANTDVNWPTGIGGKGNTGVAMFTQRIPGSISYTEYSFAKLTGLSTVQLQNRAGNFLSPCIENFQAALESMDWQSGNDFNAFILNPNGANSWPIMATTFVLLPIKAKDTAKTALILQFIYWGYTQGVTAAKQLDYIPLSSSLMGTIKNYWQQRLHIPKD